MSRRNSNRSSEPIVIGCNEVTRKRYGGVWGPGRNSMTLPSGRVTSYSQNKRPRRPRRQVARSTVPVVGCTIPFALVGVLLIGLLILLF